MGLHPISGLNVETAEATHIKRVGKGLLHNESFGERRLPPKPSKSDSRGRLAGGGLCCLEPGLQRGLLLEAWTSGPSRRREHQPFLPTRPDARQRRGKEQGGLKALSRQISKNGVRLLKQYYPRIHSTDLNTLTCTCCLLYQIFRQDFCACEDLGFCVTPGSWFLLLCASDLRRLSHGCLCLCAWVDQDAEFSPSTWPEKQLKQKCLTHTRLLYLWHAILQSDRRRDENHREMTIPIDRICHVSRRRKCPQVSLSFK